MQSQMPGRLCQKNLTGTWEETEFGHQDKTRIGTSNDPTKLRGLKLLGTFLSLIYFAQHCRLWNRDPDPVSPTTTLSHEGGKQRAVEGCSRASDLFFGIISSQVNLRSFPNLETGNILEPQPTLCATHCGMGRFFLCPMESSLRPVLQS